MRLLDAAALREGKLKAFSRRQDLEKREHESNETLFLSPAAAALALRAADRRVCFVTHAWRASVHPDLRGTTLAALLRFLRGPLGAHVVGVFVDFACLHQWPRTPRQDLAYQTALKVMADGFASPLGTTVARFTAVPACPEALAPVVAVVGAPAWAAKTVRAALVGKGKLGAAVRGKRPWRKVVKLEYDESKRVWLAELGSAAEACSARCRRMLCVCCAYAVRMLYAVRVLCV